MKLGTRITEYSLAHPKRVTTFMGVGVVLILLAAALPSLRLIDAMPRWVKQASETLDFLPAVTVDTDPENMLPAEPTRPAAPPGVPDSIWPTRLPLSLVLP